METSDSEYFESADEEIISDNEDVLHVKPSQTCQVENESKKTHDITVIEKTKEPIQNTNVDTRKNTQDTNANELPKTKKQNKDEIIDNNTCTKDDVKSEICALSKQVSEISIKEDENMWGDNEDWDLNPQDDVDKSKEDEDNMWNDDEGWGEIVTETKIATNTKPLIANSKLESSTAWNDEWEEVEKTSTNPDKNNKSNDTWGSWGNWGISSVLSTATSLTTQVSQGISSVLESSIGVPNPEELAKMHKETKKTETTPSENSNDDFNNKSPFGFGNLVSGVTQITKLVEETSTKVISGGLDTLETIGKKTMEVLQENDPGLKNKTAFLKMDSNKPILSQLLREAKEKAENKKITEEKSFRKKANYESLFDDHQGLVHLEALEMLSKQCDIKLETLFECYLGDELSEMKETMDQVKELCELPEDDEDEQLTTTDLEEKIIAAITDININIKYDKLITTWKEIEEWLSKVNLSICDENEIHQQAIESLAQLTAIAVEQFHKAAELLLIKEHRSTADEADSLVQLTTILTSLMSLASSRFTEKLTQIKSNKEDKENINDLITNVFYEAANSSSYIKDAFKLLIPVLLVGAV